MATTSFVDNIIYFINLLEVQVLIFCGFTSLRAQRSRTPTNVSDQESFGEVDQREATFNSIPLQLLKHTDELLDEDIFMT